MIITRFAPSPTGYLHIGGLRTALFCYLWAKKNGGKFLLRIEDTDLVRNSQEATDAIVEAFQWVGMQSDDTIVYQSQRFDLYKSYIQKLLDEGKAYKCYMSKEELDALRESQMAAKQKPKYDGRYRDFTGVPPEGVSPVIRIKAPLEGSIDFKDGVKGDISIDVKELDDFIIARSDGTPTYNFVVAIDDALMKVSDVIRGDDHLSNTPKQIIVYNALGFDVPRFYHVPMILNPQGKKLSKRDGAMDVMEYKNMGYLSEALLNFLVRLGWSHGDQEIFSMDQMIDLFDPNDINKSASAYNEEKLLWLSSEYIKQASADRLTNELDYFGCDVSRVKNVELLYGLIKDRAKTLKEFAQMVDKITNDPTSYDEKAVAKFLKDDALLNLENYLMLIKANQEEFIYHNDISKISQEFMKQNDIKMKDLAQPIRIALVGDAVSPSVFEIMEALGVEVVINRIENLIQNRRTLNEQ
jgi:glutamyl-tRNA synthetase